MMMNKHLLHDKFMFENMLQVVKATSKDSDDFAYANFPFRCIHRNDAAIKINSSK